MAAESRAARMSPGMQARAACHERAESATAARLGVGSDGATPPPARVRARGEEMRTEKKAAPESDGRAGRRERPGGDCADHAWGLLCWTDEFW